MIFKQHRSSPMSSAQARQKGDVPSTSTVASVQVKVRPMRRRRRKGLHLTAWRTFGHSGCLAAFPHITIGECRLRRSQPSVAHPTGDWWLAQTKSTRSFFTRSFFVGVA